MEVSTEYRADDREHERIRDEPSVVEGCDETRENIPPTAANEVRGTRHVGDHELARTGKLDPRASRRFRAVIEKRRVRVARPFDKVDRKRTLEHYVTAAIEQQFGELSLLG
jgi:hypothetical protein